MVCIRDETRRIGFHLHIITYTLQEVFFVSKIINFGLKTYIMTSKRINNIMNKYKTWYDNIIAHARNRVTDEYTELHHILPRSLGGDDSPDNLVNLTAREHFICHILLTKFTAGQHRNKMLHAAILMKSANSYQDRYFNSRLYETVRRDYANKRSLEQQGTGNSFYRKQHSDETRAKMSASKKTLYGNGNHPHIGMKRSEEVKRNISLARKGQPSPKKGLPGKKWSLETRAKMENRPYSWFTDGVTNVRAESCPAGFRKGRTLSDSHKKALTK